MARWCLLLLAVWLSSCATLPPEAARVSVYQAPLDGLPAQRRMPAGCRLLSTSARRSTTELDLNGQKDPFRAERVAAAAAGGNALLVLTKQTMSRRDFECPASSPITDCPPSFGAWYDIQIESYACTPEALQAIPGLTDGSRSRSPARSR